jgi:RNA polymerase sigma-70 factor, ECF subfamily
MDTDRSDADLMAGLASGEDVALNGLMERHGEKLFHYLIRLLQNEADAADLAQETFVRVFQHRKKFRGDARFSTWLYTIATNLARDRVRQAMRRPHVSLDAETSEQGRGLGDGLESRDLPPYAQIARDERIAVIREAVASLPEAFRIPLVLAEYEDLSQAEIAEILKCSVKAVENRIYRARQQLRKRLGKSLEAQV